MIQVRWIFFLILNKPAPDRGSNYAKLSYELGKLLRIQRLGSVGKSFVGAIVDFNQQAVSACSDGGPSHGSHLVAPARPVRRVGQNGEVRQLLDDGNRRDIEGITRVGLKGANAAFAHDHLIVTAREQVLGREQQLLDGGSNTTL